MRIKLTLSLKGGKARERIGACKYIECDAKTNEGVREVFQHATRAALTMNSVDKRGKKRTKEAAKVTG